MKYLTVKHTTTYNYANPVTLGEHRLLVRPRDSHDMRLTSAELTLSPPGETRWMHDVFGNSVAHVTFNSPTNRLTITSTLHLQRFGLDRPAFVIADYAKTYPFIYSADDRTDLGRLLERHYPDPQNVVDHWVRQFVVSAPQDTLGLLANINGAFKTQFQYNARYEEGTQTPIETLTKRSGTCRDFALLFIEAVRSLGFGARFVTGYLYDPSIDNGVQMQGAGATHAWADVYLPGVGWVEYDPTNGIIAGENLIRVSVTRDPSQAIPISGTFTGTPSDFLGLTVEVNVTSGVQQISNSAHASASAQSPQPNKQQNLSPGNAPQPGQPQPQASLPGAQAQSTNAA